MPLVDYDSSDEGSENDNEVNEKTEGNKLEEKQSKANLGNATAANNSEDATLFSSLPKPKTSFSFLADDNKLSNILLNKNDNLPLGKKIGGESIKISAPSISEFDDEKDNPPVKKLKPSVNGVGLFSVLPPTKHNAIKETNRTLVPHAVAKNQKKPTAGKDSKNVTGRLEKDMDLEGPDDDDDAGVGSSYFGITFSEPSVSVEGTSNEYQYYENTESKSGDGTNSFTGDQNTGEQNVGTNSTLNEAEASYEQDYTVDTTQNVETIPLENNPLNLDEKALQILCGNKKKRQQMPMNIIDLSGEEIMPDSKEWLLRQFTEEKKTRSHTHKKGQGPSSQQRRKHQITYLAYQAKEMELELKNQWANNRMSRKQTQSKYGF